MTEEKKPGDAEMKEEHPIEASEDAPKEENAGTESPNESGEEAGRAENPEESEDEGEAFKKRCAELEDRHLRLMAEYQNYRRRTEKEKNDIYAYANEEFAKQLLDVLDNFERAMEAETADEKYKEGMELILKQLKTVLEKNKVEEIDALSKPFDPNFHNAVMNVEAEGFESGTVAKVFRKGYTLNSKVIRPAMVAVAQ